MRILLVEDEPEIRHVVSEYLSGSGHQVVAAASGHEAIELIERAERAFDAAIVDWQMTGISGRDVLELLHERFPQTALFLCTGLGQGQLPERPTEAPLQGIFHKPFSMRKLNEALHRVMRARGQG